MEVRGAGNVIPCYYLNRDGSLRGTDPQGDIYSRRVHAGEEGGR